MQRLLLAQSFVVGGPGSYWDYRDYIFCLCSNPAVVNEPIRLNVERGGEAWLNEFNGAAAKNGFSDFKIMTAIPPSWKSYMLEQVEANPSVWTMPWPGDHIYINPDPSAFDNALAMGEKLNADAVAYSHTQDFEYLVDWERVNILYDDPDYVMIEWGHRYRYCQNPRLRKAARKVVPNPIIMTPVPGFVIYKSVFFNKILEALPLGTTRWQDMEHAPAKSAEAYKLLIPKKCLYRHVHGYWLEGFFKYESVGGFPAEVKKEIESWYVKADYDWRENSPTASEYGQRCLSAQPYFIRYLSRRSSSDFPNKYGASPFDSGWKKTTNVAVVVVNLVKTYLMDRLRRCVAALKTKFKRRAALVQ